MGIAAARSNRWVIPALLGLAALAGVALIVVGTGKYGIGLETDSVGYIQLAREIRAGQGISPAWTLQPPLYSLTLTLGALVTFSDPVTVAVWLNALLWGGILLLAGLVLWRALPRAPMLAVVGVLGLVLARPMLDVTLVAYSEPLFVLLVLVALYSLGRFGEAGQWRWFALAIAATTLACLTRYIGVALIATGGLVLLWIPAAPWGKRIGRTVGFGVGVMLPLALWALRNYIVSGEPFGARASSRFGLFQNFRFSVNTFTGWFVPDGGMVLLWVVLTLLAVGALVWWVGTLRTNHFVPGSGFTVLPFVVFCLIYILVLVVTSTLAAYNRISTRLLTPLFVPSWIVFVVGVERVTQLFTTRVTALVLQGAAVVIVGVAALYPSQDGWTRTARALEAGAGGYNTTRWRTSPTVAYLTAHRDALTEPLYSNGAEILYILDDLPAQSILPKYQYGSNDRAYDAANLRGAYPSEPSLLVWFNTLNRDDFYFSLPEMQDMTQLTFVAKLVDGAVYRMEKRKD